MLFFLLYYLLSRSVYDPSFFGGNLVLTADRLTYESAEIQQMKAYLNNLPGAPLPKTLQWISGGPSKDKQENDSSIGGCKGYLGITNISQTTIQLSQINLRLTADAEPNTNIYRLIDICSIVTNQSSSNPYRCVPTGGGGMGYRASFLLGAGRTNSVFPGQLASQGVSASDSSYPTITPGQEVDISLDFATATSTNLVYSVIPELTLNMSGTQSIKELSQLTSTLAFLNTSQLACYRLQGDTFVSTSLSPLINDPERMCM